MAIDNTIVDGGNNGYKAEVTSANRLQVNTQGGAAGGTSSTDDGAFTVATDSGTPAMGIFSADTVDAGDVGVLAMDASRRLLVSIEVDNVGIGGGTQYTEDVATPAAIVGTAGMMERDDIIATLTPVEGDWAAFRCSAEGALWVQEFNSDAIRAAVELIDNAISGSEMQVDIVAALPAGANSIGTLGANSGVDIGDVDVTSITGVTMSNAGMQITGDEAHDAADAGNPVKIGHKAVLFNSSAPPNAAAAEDDRVNSIADEYGRQYVEITHPNYWDVSVDYATAQTNATVKAAAGAGLSLYITDIICSNGATAGNITLLDGSGGTVLWELYPAVNGGATQQLRSPIKLTANTLLAITSTTVTTHSLTVSGFIAP